MRIRFDVGVSWFGITSYVRDRFFRAWSSIRDFWSPLIRGPVELKPEAFIGLLQKHRPATMMAQWCHFNNWKDGNVFSFTFRAGRTLYSTYFYVEVARTGYLQDALPASFLALAGQESAIFPIRDPARRLDAKALLKIAA